ncbi:NUDIX domain-containing protein [Nocardia fusca]|uniref:NUDIX domain-containing protein n=1 Tax=Nocardia fusca TaxID=941183 RepID=UPI0037C86310
MCPTFSCPVSRMATHHPRADAGEPLRCRVSSCPTSDVRALAVSARTVAGLAPYRDRGGARLSASVVAQFGPCLAHCLGRAVQVFLGYAFDWLPWWYEDGAYHLPSGHLEAGESVVAALVREAKEEIGVTIDPAGVGFAHVMHNSPSVVGWLLLSGRAVGGRAGEHEAGQM